MSDDVRRLRNDVGRGADICPTNAKGARSIARAPAFLGRLFDPSVAHFSRSLGLLIQQIFELFRPPRLYTHE